MNLADLPPFRRPCVIAALCLVVAAATVSAGGPPTRTVVDEPVLLVCPAGDASFHVTALDFAMNPVANSGIAAMFYDCPDAHVAPIAATDPYQSCCGGGSFVMYTGLDGRVAFPLRAGGFCAGAHFHLRADGYEFATRNVVSPDQNGDLVVDPRDLALLLERLHAPAFDAAADLDGNGRLDVRDLAVLLRHVGHHA